MVAIKLKYLQVFSDRHGVTRYYFRRKGYETATLPGEPLSPEFMKAYHEAMGRKVAPPTPVAEVGTVKAALLAWFRSTGFRSLEPPTQRVYRQQMERELDKHMHKPLARLERRHVKDWIAAMMDRPGAAKTFLKRLKTWLTWCVDEELISVSPATGVKPPSYVTEGFIPWTDADNEKYNERWALGTKERLCKDLLAYTGQRISDVAKMGRQDDRGTHIYVCQAKIRKDKKRVKITIPKHLELRRSLEAANVSGQLLYLQNKYGKPYSVKGLSQTFAEWTREAGIEEKTAHGLRKFAGGGLADAGCSANEIMAVLGLSSMTEAEKYVKSAQQKRLANQAIDKWENAASEV